MRVGIDVTCFLEPKTGVGRYTYEIIRSISQFHEDVAFVPFSTAFATSPAWRLAQDPALRMRIQRSFLMGRALTFLWRQVNYPVDWLTGPIEVFHSTNFRVFPVRKAKLVITVYDLTVLKFPELHYRKRILEMRENFRRIARSDAVIAVSENTRQDLLLLTDLEPSKIEVIYGGISSNFTPVEGEAVLDEVVAHYGLPERFILFVGTLEPRKNIEGLINAFAWVKERWRDVPPLVLVGRVGWLGSEVLDRIRKLEASGDVTALGFVDDRDLPTLMRRASIFVFPSLYEGFGLPPLEAMACGTPVVASNAPALPEVLGDAAILVDPYDVEALGRAMRRLINDQVLRKEMIVRGFERTQLFTWERAARQTWELYQRVYGG